MKKIAVAIALFIVFSANAFALDVGFLSVREMQEYCERILSHLQGGDVDSAFVLIKSQWLFDPAEIDSVWEKTANQLPGLQNRFGDILAVSEVGSERVGELLIRFIYVIKYERHVVRWLFVFYKPRTKWILNSFKWDDSISELF